MSAQNGRPSPSRAGLPDVVGLFSGKNSDGAPREKKSSAASAEDLSPFLGARLAVEDRVRKEAQEKHRYAVFAGLLGVCLLVAVSGLVFVSAQSRIEPWPIVYNGADGSLLHSGPIEPMTAPSDLMTRSALADVLEGLREVYTDRRATVKSFQRAYGHVIRDSPADAFLNDHYTRHGTPVALVGDLQRTVIEKEIGRLAGTRTWKAEWAEHEALEGGGVRQTIYEGSFSVRHSTPTTSEELSANPYGLYVEGIAWQEVSSKILKQEDLGAGADASSR